VFDGKSDVQSNMEVEMDTNINAAIQLLRQLPARDRLWVVARVLPELEHELFAENLPKPRPTMTAANLLDSDLVGMWADRDDLGDSVSFAQHLRQQAQHRGEQK
jgi:hypothetical protein